MDKPRRQQKVQSLTHLLGLLANLAPLGSKVNKLLATIYLKYFYRSLRVGVKAWATS